MGAFEDYINGSLQGLKRGVTEAPRNLLDSWKPGLVEGIKSYDSAITGTDLPYYGDDEISAAREQFDKQPRSNTSRLVDLIGNYMPGMAASKAAPVAVRAGETVLGAGPAFKQKVAEAAADEYDPFARFIQVSDLRDQAAKRLADEGNKPVVLMNPQNRGGAFISPNSDEHGAWRMTDFDRNGFSGHRYFDDKEKAARAAYADGYKDKNRNLLREYSLLDTFSDGNDATHARLQANRALAASKVAPVAAKAGETVLGSGPTATKMVADALPDARLSEIAKRFGLSEDEVRNIVGTKTEELRARDEYIPPSQTEEPLTDFPRYPEGSAKIGLYGDPNNSYVSVLRKFNPKDVVPTEPEDMIRQHPTFQRYVDWFKQGHEPPPIDVYQSEKTPGGYLTSNRRRALTAREAGVDALSGWLSPNNTESGLPLKYGDIMRAYNQE